MSKVIYKYELDIVDLQKLQLPKKGTILSVVEQENTIVLYVLVDRDELELEYIEFQVVGTGHLRDDLEDSLFLGTVKFHDGALMFHVFVKP